MPCTGISGRPAEQFRVPGRGIMEAGYMAHLVLFDREEIASPTTYENPMSAVGIKFEFREGREISPGSDTAARKHEPAVDA